MFNQIRENELGRDVALPGAVVSTAEISKRRNSFLVEWLCQGRWKWREWDCNGNKETLAIPFTYGEYGAAQ